MKTPGQIVLFNFPHTDRSTGKMRPALLLARLPGPYDDWLICMISSQLKHCFEGFDEVVAQTDTDFQQSGLRTPSVIRIGRLAVTEGRMLMGAIGKIGDQRLVQIKSKITRWLAEP